MWKRGKQQGVADIHPDLESRIVEGEFIVTFRKGVAESRRKALVNEVASSARHFSTNNRGRDGRRGPALFERFVHVKLKKGRAAEAAWERFKNLPEVERVEPDRLVFALANPGNDPGLDQMWSLHNTGQTGGTADADIDAPEAWEITTGSRDVIVAVIDTGIEYTHPDLEGNMWINSGEVPDNGVDDDNNGLVDDFYGYDFYNGDGDPMDDHFHGTHVAGTIGAVGNNALGVVGVNWNVRLMALKFLNAGGGGHLSDAILAIQYAVNNGAHVMSNSWGGTGTVQALQDAINTAHAAGVAFIAAAGNSATDTPFYPAAHDHVIAVSATDHDDQKASFSNYGSYVDVAAPGVAILSTYLDGGYALASGTSMAAPHVAGLAALLKARNFSLTGDQIESILENTADDLGPTGWDDHFGYGRINARRAVETLPPQGEELPAADIASPVANQPVSGTTVEIQGTAAGTDFASYALEYSDTSGWVVIASSQTPVENGILGTWDVSSLAERGHTLRLSVRDRQGRAFFDAARVHVDNVASDLALDLTLPPAPNALAAIHGTAAANYGSFGSYTVEYRSPENPDQWSSSRVALANGGSIPIRSGLLATFDLAGLPLGAVIFRLTVSTATAEESVEQRSFVDPYQKPGWPQVFSDSTEYLTMSVTVGDLDGQGPDEILATHDRVGVLAYDPGGNLLFTQDTRAGVATSIPVSSPALAQLSSSTGLEYGFYDYLWNQMFASAIDTLLPGYPFPATRGQRYVYAKTVATMAYDLDGDGRDELITPMTDRTNNVVSLVVLDQAGQTLPGFPFTVSLPDIIAYRAGAVGDLDGDGRAEIFFSVVAEGNQRAVLYGVNQNGTGLSGFPIEYSPLAGGNDEAFFGDIAIADLDRNGRKEIIFVETVVDATKQMARWAVHVLSKGGVELSGWPYLVSGTRTETGFPGGGGLLAVGDVTGDGYPEVVVGQETGDTGGILVGGPDIHVLDRNGSVVYQIRNAYINEYGYTLFANPAGISLVDLDGDGAAEVLVKRLVYLSDGDHRESSPLVAVLAYRFGAGSPMFRVAALPVPETQPGGDTVWIGPSHFSYGHPAVVADSDRDGRAELLLRSPGFLHVWDLPYAYSPQATEWAMLQGNVSHTGEYVPKSLRGGNEPPPEEPPPEEPPPEEPPPEEPPPQEPPPEEPPPEEPPPEEPPPQEPPPQEPPPPALHIEAVTPSTVSSGRVQIMITGTGFEPGGSLSFQNGDGPAPKVKSSVLVASETLQVTLSVKATGKPRHWDVVVSNPDGREARLPKGLTVK